MRKVNVLLTGSGGNQAIFIWKALRQANLDIRIVACDCSPLSVGLYRADKSYLVPAVNHPEYLSALEKIIQTEHIDIVMLGTMVEMRLLSKHAHRIREATGAYVVTSPPEVLARAEDKWHLVCFLKSQGFSYPRTVLPDDRVEYEAFLDEVDFPFIIKDRQGAGSKGLAVVHNLKDLNYHLEKTPRAIVQEYLKPDDEEYTVGCFTDSKGDAVGSIVMRRKLGLGLTNKAEVLESNEISQFCEEVASRIGLIGPSNLQLRLTDRGPVLFEINPRFSSTESARAFYNFNAPEMCIRHFLFGEKIDRPVIKTGYFFRVFDDVFVENEMIRTVQQSGCAENSSGVILHNF